MDSLNLTDNLCALPDLVGGRSKLVEETSGTYERSVGRGVVVGGRVGGVGGGSMKLGSGGERG